jgi:DNA-binding transcriptional LysR family regulator/DNA-binding SARP family transcriptional activator
LLEADRVVQLPTLIDVLWENAPPATAAKQVRNAVSRLRKVLTPGGVPGVIATHAAGYVLTTAAGTLDARLFEAKAAQAARAAAASRLDEAARLLEKALQLWRGPLLAGLGGPVIEAAATAWEERWCGVTETYHEYHLALGRHREMLGRLTIFAAKHPLREKPAGHLMLALYRCGRQADALAVYAQTRKRLARELGLEPGSELASLHQQILTGDRALAAPHGTAKGPLGTPGGAATSGPTSPGRQSRAELSSDRDEVRFAEVSWNEIELRELRYFVAVAEELHFTRAAARLRIAQQALSSAVRGLEARLGGKLFERTSRQVRLTYAGEKLLPLASQVLADAQRCVAVTRDALLGVDGRIRLGVCRAACALGEPVMLAMARQYPGIELERSMGFLPALIDALRDGRLDAIIADCAPEVPALAYQRLSDQPAVVAMDPDHRLAGRAMVRIEELADELVVVVPDDIGRHWNGWTLELFARAGLCPKTVEASGLGRPPGTKSGETLAISSAIALAWSPVNDALVKVRLSGVTMPFDLLWRRNQPSPAINTLRRVAYGMAAEIGWPRNDIPGPASAAGYCPGSIPD